ncbi:NADH dehydrogenase [ubiquinone] 1 alpha subcomplex subunit 6 [Glycine soja]|uniref:NADH dehydrogenase [ubiquinone] 1 alpha subcomplex subunit 6 n=1 Tax=Glycine soja TaxID=3848 RepID=A0A445I747_GLYSO|nr:NADH dehydrogenase [ubiquinone] 1 alpha subcomplex subunit 6 [Glycine soja]
MANAALRNVKVLPNSANMEEARHRVFEFFRTACRSLPSVMEIYNLYDVVSVSELRSSVASQIRNNIHVTDPKLTLPGGIRLFIVVVCEWISGYLLSMLSMVDSGIWQKAQVPPYKHAIAAYDTAIVGHFLHIGIHQYGGGSYSFEFIHVMMETCEKVIDMLLFKGMEELKNVVDHSKQRHHIIGQYVVGRQVQDSATKDPGTSTFLKNFYNTNYF